MSSTETLGRPASAARALAARISACPARGPGAPGDVLADVRRAAVRRARGSRAPGPSRSRCSGPRPAPCRTSRCRAAIRSPLRVGVISRSSAPGREPVDPPLLVGRRIGDEDLEQEPVELRLGQRIGALLLDRVLRGQDEERLGQGVPAAAGGHLPLLHGLQQRGLGLGRRPVDLVGEDQVGEDRARDEPQLPRAGVAVLVEHLGAGDVAGHQVGRELDAVEVQRERLRQRVHHQGLGQARDALQDAVPAGEDGHQQLLDDLILPDDPAGDLLADLVVRRRNCSSSARSISSVVVVLKVASSS